MLYPNNIKKDYQKTTTYSNRGMDLEGVIESTNEYYRDNDIAYIYKKPTPIGVTKVAYSNKGKRIQDGYYKSPSTLDFNGLYKGYYIEFDAKVTENKTSFPISNVHDHQIKHIYNINKHGGIVFLIIMMNNKYFLLMGNTFLDFIKNNTRKSIPYEFLEKNAYEMHLSLKGLDYLEIINKLIGGNK